jgi:hypothetical protein
MCFYCKAASLILDSVWDQPEMRERFTALGADLSTLGPLVHELFVPAYRGVKDALDSGALAMLEAQVTEDMLTPYYERPGFRQIWDEWDAETRADFVREQSEAELARLLLQFYDEDFAAAYMSAYSGYTARA